MNWVQEEKEKRKKAQVLADKLLPHFNGLTQDVAFDVLSFLRTRLDDNFRHNTPLVLKEEE